MVVKDLQYDDPWWVLTLDANGEDDVHFFATKDECEMFLEVHAWPIPKSQ